MATPLPYLFLLPIYACCSPCWPPPSLCCCSWVLSLAPPTASSAAVGRCHAIWVGYITTHGHMCGRWHGGGCLRLNGILHYHVVVTHIHYILSVPGLVGARLSLLLFWVAIATKSVRKGTCLVSLRRCDGDGDGRRCFGAPGRSRRQKEKKKPTRSQLA